jgi:hypothetical protein
MVGGEVLLPRPLFCIEHIAAHASSHLAHCEGGNQILDGDRSIEQVQPA